MQLLRRYSSWLGRWPVALATVLVLALVVLLPGLGSTGLWEPHERSLADRVAPPLEIQHQQDEAAREAREGRTPAPPTGCLRTAPEDAAARSLDERAPRFGRDTFGDSDGGRRLPFALMGLLTVLATAGIAMRLTGPRAGVIAGLVVLSMPLLTLQSRMLTSEIGTACGASLLVYGLVAVTRTGTGRGLGVAAVDAAISVAALVLGSYLGFHGGGVLLGLVVPLGAYAAAGGLGVPGVISIVRRERFLAQLPALFAGVVAIYLLAILVHQIYELKTPVPGMMPPARQLFGSAIVADPCWSSALGGVWRPDDDLRMIFDSTFEQIAYGTFPWGVLAPIAMAALLHSEDRGPRAAGALALAWGAGAWIASEVFQRKVGFTIYAGFPALAIAIGAWLDGVLTRRARGDREGSSGGLILLGLFVLLAVVNLGKDMHSFPDRITSLLIGAEQLKYPMQSKLLVLPTKTWILVIGGLAAAGFALSMIAWRPGDQARARTLQRLAGWAIAVALALTVVMAAFWAFVWQPRIAQHVSSRAMFDTYRELRGEGDQLVIMGDLGHAPLAYAPNSKPELVPTRDRIVKALHRPNRVFAIAPQTELCTLHREVGGKPYYVIDDRNVRNLLLSNSVEGTEDKNPLATAIVHTEPTEIAQRPNAPVIWDRRIQLLGWSIPTRMARGSKVEVTLYYKILQPVGGAWKSLMHFDGPLRFNGDHEPIKGRCPTSTWQPGDFIIDTHVVKVGGGAFPPGRYDLWIGFFTGSAPNWKNMPVSEAPAEMRDTADRVKIMSVVLD